METTIHIIELCAIGSYVGAIGSYVGVIFEHTEVSLIGLM